MTKNTQFQTLEISWAPYFFHTLEGKSMEEVRKSKMVILTILGQIQQSHQIQLLAEELNEKQYSTGSRDKHFELLAVQGQKAQNAQKQPKWSKMTILSFPGIR